MTDLVEIYNRLKDVLENYRPPFYEKMQRQERYELWSKKEAFVAGKLRSEVYFAGLIIQSNYVGFYYMPVYVEAEIKTIFKPELLKLLKGKTCFHIKKLDAQLIEQIELALKKGYTMYKEKGWV